MSTDETAGRLADDLALLGAGQLSEPEFRARWRAGADGPLDVVLSNIEHYLNDLDIFAIPDVGQPFGTLTAGCERVRSR